MVNRILFLFAFGVTFQSWAQAADPIKDIQQQFDKLGGYTFLPVQRTDYQVGALVGRKKNKELFIRKAKECFGEAFLKEVYGDPASAKTFSLNRAYDFDLALGAKVANLIPLTDEIEAEFKKKNVQKMSIDLGTMKIYGISTGRMRDEVKSRMTKSCQEDFGLLPKDAPVSKDKFVILESVQSDNYAISFNDSKNTTVMLKASILKKLFPSVSFGSKAEVIGKVVSAGTTMPVAIKSVWLKEVGKFSADGLPNLMLVPRRDILDISIGK